MLCCCYFLLLICVDAKRLVIIDNDDKRPSIDEEGGFSTCLFCVACLCFRSCPLLSLSICCMPALSSQKRLLRPQNRKILFASSGHRCDLSQLLLVLVVGSWLLHDDIQAFCKKSPMSTTPDTSIR